MKLIERLLAYSEEHPFSAVMLTAAAVRLIAVIFAKGFMASDDYFVYLHIPWEWARGMSSWFDMDHPSGFSIVYPGVNYLIIVCTNFIGLSNPEIVMYINRFLHAAWSLISVALAYRLTVYATENRQTAFTAGMMTALFSFLPYGSVRNLPEMVCLPLVMMYLFTAERATRENLPRLAFFSGIAIASAFVFRYQSLIFAAGALGMFLARRQWKLLTVFSIGSLIPALVQGLIDLIAYDKFFGAPLQYFFYNIEHSSEYIVGPWYRYLLLFAGLFIPPFSLVFLPAIVGAWKKAPITLISTLVFIILHSIIPAKQERFVIPATIPLIVLGTIGLAEWMRSPKALRFKTPMRWMWRWFWALNGIILVLFLFHYGKRGQIEALNELRNRADVNYLVVDRTDKGGWLPLYYLGLPEYRCYWISEQKDWSVLDSARQSISMRPNYAFINVPLDINSHIQNFSQFGFNAEIIGRYGPAPLEWLLAKANPRFNSTNEVWLLKLSPITQTSR
jgi:hypothetical protein